MVGHFEAYQLKDETYLKTTFAKASRIAFGQLSVL
jgi:hypothetical protein